MAAAALFVGTLALVAGAGPAHAAADVDADPGSLNLGEVRVGTIGTDDQGGVVTLTNNGDTPATIGEIVNEGNQESAFSGVTGMDPDTGDSDSAHDCLYEPDGVTPRVLGPGESCTIQVSVYPIKAGVNTTVMKVKDDMGNDLAAVTLNATGTVGYYISGAFGEVVEFGDGVFYGDSSTLPLNDPIIDIKQVPFGEGYWQLGLDGGVFTYGPDARFLGSTGGMQLNAPVVSMDATSSEGYYLAALDGGVFAYGPDAAYHGSMGGKPLNAPVVGIAVDPVHDGYWLVGADGGVFTFGESKFHGSMGGRHLNEPIVGIIATPTGDGYWLVASDGGVFAFGDAVFRGSLGGTPLNQPIVDLAASPTGLGYWMLALDGGVFALGDAPFLGGTENIDLTTGITGTAPPTYADWFGDGGYYFSVNEGFGDGGVVIESVDGTRAAPKAGELKAQEVQKVVGGGRSLITLRDVQ